MLWDLALILFPLALFGAFVGGIGYWVLGPMHLATRESKLPTQFFVSDFFWLLAQFQIAIAIVLITPYESGSFGWGLLLVCAAISVAAMWWASVSALSRAGVGSPLRRAVFILIVVPVGTVGVVVAFFAATAGIFALAATYFEHDDAEAAKASWLLLLTLPAALLFYATRRLTLWVLAGRKQIPPSPIPDEDHSPPLDEDHSR